MDLLESLIIRRRRANRKLVTQTPQRLDQPSAAAKKRRFTGPQSDAALTLHWITPRGASGFVVNAQGVTGSSGVTSLAEFEANRRDRVAH